MLEEYSNAVNEFNKQLQAAGNRVPGALIQRNQNPGPKYARRFFQIAEQERRTTAGFQALYLACVADDASAKGGVFKQAVDRILEDYAKQPWLHRAFQGTLRRGPRLGACPLSRRRSSGTRTVTCREPPATTWPST